MLYTVVSNPLPLAAPSHPIAPPRSSQSTALRYPCCPDASHELSYVAHGSGYPTRTFLVAQTVKRLPTMPETWVQSLGREDPLEKEMATHSSVLAWRIPGPGEPAGLPPMGSHRVRHD